MALSASAPPAIAKAIAESLHLKAPFQVMHGLDKPNIFLSWSKSKGLAVSQCNVTYTHVWLYPHYSSSETWQGLKMHLGYLLQLLRP